MNKFAVYIARFTGGYREPMYVSDKETAIQCARIALTEMGILGSGYAMHWDKDDKFRLFGSTGERGVWAYIVTMPEESATANDTTADD